MFRKFFGYSVTLGVLCGCSSIPPAQEMSDARLSVAAAQDADAKTHAPTALNSAKQLLSQAENDIRSGDFDEAQIEAVAAREAARQALAISTAKQRDLAQKPALRTLNYTVRKGDSLWNIAATPNIYGDPFLWPLISKSNATEIKDSDLIYPGQKLTIELDPSSEEQRRATVHARSRGFWSLGRIEIIDQSYLRP